MAGEHAKTGLMLYAVVGGLTYAVVGGLTNNYGRALVAGDNTCNGGIAGYITCYLKRDVGGDANNSCLIA